MFEKHEKCSIKAAAGDQSWAPDKRWCYKIYMYVRGEYYVHMD